MIETETGLPGSTEQNLNLILDENLIVEGHDSSGDLVPMCYTSGMEDGINEKEEEILSLVENEDEDLQDALQNMSLIAVMINTMKVKSLKESLLVKNLSRTGNKAILVARLKYAIANGMAIVENIDQDMLHNMVGDEFVPTAHWKYLVLDEDTVV